MLYVYVYIYIIYISDRYLLSSGAVDRLIGNALDFGSEDPESKPTRFYLSILERYDFSKLCGGSNPPPLKGTFAGATHPGQPEFDLAMVELLQ